jgi:hypothetical protein
MGYCESRLIGDSFLLIKFNPSNFWNHAAQHETFPVWAPRVGALPSCLLAPRGKIGVWPAIDKIRRKKYY